MSSKKEKLLEEARKFILKGQLDKAIKAYQQVVALEPAAINHRQKVAELLVKSGLIEEARAEYENIGKNYASNGFYLKAIAVYKQIQKLFPKDIKITLILAELNEKHGLISNAVAEYKQAYDFYIAESCTEESLKILEKMLNIDQQNVGIKIKLAEAYFNAGKNNESYAQFGQIALMLQEKGDTAAFARLNARVLQFFPDKSDFLLQVLAKQVKEGSVGKAVSWLQVLLRSNPHDKNVWELTIQAYKRLEQPQKLKAVYQHFLQFFPDETTAKIGLIACCAALNDLQGALVLLDQYENEILSAGYFEELEGIYRTLERIDPINIRILQGLSKVYEAAGKQDEVAALALNIKSIKKLSGNNEAPDPFGDADEIKKEDSSLDLDEDSPADVQLQNIEEPACVGEAPEPGVEPEVEEIFDELGDEAEVEDEEIEIEVDLDEDFTFDLPANEEGAGFFTEEIDSFDDVFDMITTSPRAVKFGDDLDGPDAQSHYDLGVAFKEMGLYDEAINEFHQAASDPVRKVECLILQGACLRARGELDTAESVLKALMKPGLCLENSCAVRYELALTLEAKGESERAATLMAEISAINPGFRDVNSRLNVADAGSPLDFSDEDLLDFELK